jgi:hypothetical protein
MKTKTMVAALALGGALGCGGSTNGLPPNQPVQRQLALTAFKDDQCDALRDYIADNAVLQMKASLEMEKQYWQYRNYDGPVNAGSSGGADTASAPASNQPSSYTTTNTQVAGVDEADFVKNDGTRLFVLTGQRLYTNRTWPADQLSVQGALDLEGWPREMFLDGDTVTVFSNVYTAYPMDIAPGVAMPACGADLMDCGYWYGNTTKVTEVDVSDLAHPRVLSEVYLPGSYNTSRKVGHEARVVLSDQLRWPQGLQYWPENSGTISSQLEWNVAIDALEQKNEALIRATPLASWLPVGKRRLEDGSLVDLSYKCSDFSRSNAPSEGGIVTVASLDLPRPDADPQRSSLLANVSTVYADADSLYVASPHWYWWPEPGEQDFTYLYKFDISGPKARFVAGGGVDGITYDQFSLDEYQGHLRVATQVSRLVDDGDNPWGRWETTNQLAVLAQDGASLHEVGKLKDIAPGEWLMGARFVGPRAFLSTFLYTDPFFTFDLSDPENPKRVGQLEVPGYSSYLQAIDDTHVLAIGMHLPDTSGAGGGDGSGGVASTSDGIPLQLSLFDVSDLANPVLVDRKDVGVGDSWSDALWDHKAFNWYPERKLLAIPFCDWIYDANDYWGSFVSDLRVFSVDPVQGITARGALSMSDVYAEDGNPYWGYYWWPQIRRSVMADDFVYAISDAGVRVANVASLGTPVATARFPAPGDPMP